VSGGSPSVRACVRACKRSISEPQSQLPRNITKKNEAHARTGCQNLQQVYGLAHDGAHHDDRTLNAQHVGLFAQHMPRLAFGHQRDQLGTIELLWC
jgi:hypothetical protein